MINLAGVFLFYILIYVIKHVIMRKRIITKEVFFMRFRQLLFLLALMFLFSVNSFAKGDNLWDYSKIEITNYSQILNLEGHKIENIFKNNKGKQRTEKGSVLYNDLQPDNFPHFVEWKMKYPGVIKSVELYANCDMPGTGRKLKTWKLYGKAAESDDWTLIYEYTPPKGVYIFEQTGDIYKVKATDVDIPNYTFFRSEFLQNDEESPNSGPIIFGVKAYAEPVNDNLLNGIKEPKYATFLLHNQGRDAIEGIRKFVAGMKSRGTYNKIGLTVTLNGSEPDYADDSQKVFFRELYDDGHELTCEYASQREKVANWLGIDPNGITTIGAQLFGDVYLEEEVNQNKAGIKTSVNSCVEGNSLAEFWDIPHNWEGSPMFPYYVQWNAENPLDSSRVNRELDKDNAVLELSWGTRTLWHNYDRFPIPQAWHVGEPSKPSQWRVGPLVSAGQYGGWWNAELAEFEKNFYANRTPYLYLSVTIEANWFTDMIRPQVDPDVCMNNGLDLIDLFLRKGWSVVTCRDFTKWYSGQWPCPKSPSMVYLMEDTLANRVDRDGKVIIGNGHLLHAETQHFQITDSDNRIAPELIVAYDCKTPNLVRGGYTFANPKKFPSKETNLGHYASTTGNAIFWSPSKPICDIFGSEYFESYKEEDCKNRTFTFYFGDKWEDYQFVKGEFSKVRRISDDEVTWTKEMLSPAPGTDIRIKYTHILKGNKHIVKVDVDGKDAEKLNGKFRVSPYFHQGWDLAPEDDFNDPFVPDWRTAGQERNVFAKVNGTEFAYSENNATDIFKTIKSKQVKSNAGVNIDIYNRNPGIGITCDDNPLFNRGFTLNVDKSNIGVSFEDLAGPKEFVTCEIDLGKYKKGQSYVFTFEYWNGEK